MNRKINTLGKSNKKALLIKNNELNNYPSSTTIRRYKKDFNVATSDEAYEILKEAYNLNLEISREEKVIENKKLKLNNLLGAIKYVPDVKTKLSSDERKARHIIKQNEANRKEKQSNANIFSKRYIKALGVFQDIEIDGNINENDLGKIIYENIMNEFYKKEANRNLKVNAIIEYDMYKNKGDRKNALMFYYHSSNEEPIKSPNQISEWVDNEIEKFWTKVEEQKYSSDFIFDKINNVRIQIVKSKLSRAGSYIPLDKWIEDKKATVNIKNNDEYCLEWCLIGNKYYDLINSKTKNEVRHYKKYIGEIKKPENQTYPVDVLKDIPKYEKLNNIKINVFQYVSKTLTVIYNTRDRNSNICDLLLISEGDKNHFVLIRDISKLLRDPAINRLCKRFYCRQCLCANYETEEKLNKHLEICNLHQSVQVKMPVGDEAVLKFKNYGNSFEHPFTVFMDFESTLEPINEVNKSLTTVKTQRHIANSCGLKYNCIHDEHSECEININSPNPEALLEKVILQLEEYALNSYNLLQKNKHLKFENYSKELKQKHFSFKTCQDCQCEFTDTNKKVLHHNHINGEYINTICNQCNLKYQYKKFLPVIAHNLKGYDAHFIIPLLNKYGRQGKINCIANNEEKFMSFSKHIQVDEYFCIKDNIMKPVMFEIRFLDSLAFMNSSLDKLAKNLTNGCKSTDELRKVFKNVSDEYKNDIQFNEMLKKGIYPYDYITNYDVLNEDKLPSITAFHSKLNNSKCNQKDYQQAVKVWELFKCNTLMDYHNLYLKSDVLILADVWENFKRVCKKIYDLDVSYYYTAPGLSWDAWLKHTNAETIKQTGKQFEIELLTDLDMYLFFEKSIRGGLSQISKRYAKANHKGLADYKPENIDEYILYLDANNLYGAGMVSYLPQKDFKWNTNEWTSEEILQLSDTDNKGYLFEVDLHYPKELHDLHNGYALAVENKCVKNDMLNSWQTADRKDSKIEKLITSFNDKIKYGVNYRLLKLFIQQGLIITKVHRVLEYTQSDFMASYIMKNTNERTFAKNDFEKDFYKLMNNSVYGKTMENVRNRINFVLVTSEEQALNILNTRVRHTVFNENCVGVHLLKKECKLFKPIFIGQTVLDESKLVMCDFHYNFMLKNFKRENIDVLFTDTDSLCYHIKNQNPYEVIKNNKGLFDLSAYPKNNELYDATNKKVIGKFKDESVDGEMNYITEFIGLRSKLYSYETEFGEKEHNRAKGIKKSALVNNERSIRHQDFRNCLFERQSINITQNTFRSYKHNLYTESITKVALSCYDDKSFILNNNIDTLTIGHYKAKQE